MCALLIGLHGVSILLLGNGAWRGMWFGLGRWPPALEAAAELALAAAVALWWGRGSRWARSWILAMSVLAAMDALRYWTIVATGRVASTVPLPLSLGVAVALGFCAAHAPRRRSWPGELASAALAGVILPLLWMGSFGLTDYRRPADAVLVLGARVYSLAMADRMSTGLELHRHGLARRLIFSGGGREPDAMRHLAAGAAVPDGEIVLDSDGVNTRASARSLARLARERGWRRILVVSHYYHLPRVKLACLQEGLDVYTVPCRMTRRLGKEPYFVLRECVAFYAYLLNLDGLWRDR